MNTIPLRRRVASVLIATALATCAAEAERPNFLFIALDDLVPLTREHLDDPASVLNTLVPHRGARRAISARLTPNINRLASRGVTFTNTWTNYPLCNPSRVSLLTGISAARSGYHVDREYTFRDPRSRLQGATTLPQRLREAGYATLGVGKIFHFSESKHRNAAVVSDWPDIEKSWTTYLEKDSGTLENIQAAPAAGTGLLKFGVEKNATALQPDWINAGLAAELLRDRTVRTKDSHGQHVSMELRSGQPFFLALGIRRPHGPWAVPREWFSRVPRSVFRHARISLNLERSDLDDLRGYSASGSRIGSFFRYDQSARSARTSRARLLQAIRHYLAAVAFADACVGGALDALDASPYARNTVVVLWSDHGYSWGQKLQLGKSNLWESSLRSEFIIADLRSRPPKSGQERQPVSLLDIYPTVCDLAGLGSGGPPNGDGVSLASVLNGRSAPRGRAILASFGEKQRAIRLGPWKYITYGEGARGDELYRLDSDPLERRNLLRGGVRPAIVSHLQAEIRRLSMPY